jgi:lipopolysaccharide/colanic/teichoic acid biosynthesis glycosyltransferase
LTPFHLLEFGIELRLFTVTEEPGPNRGLISTETRQSGLAATPAVLMEDVKIFTSDGMYLEGVAESSFRYTVVKRSIDLAVSSFLIALLAPLFLLIAALVRISSPGPVLYRERRVGRFGKHFTIYKFRSMYTREYLHGVLKFRENEHDQLQRRIAHKHVHDPRITRVGYILRKLSLDELPQLFNIMKGEMSLVGPRPVVDAEMPHYGSYAIFYKLVFPGLSGLWQVSGRNDVDFKTRVRMDVSYCRKWSLRMDLAILAKTFPAVLKRKGAY